MKRKAICAMVSLLMIFPMLFGALAVPAMAAENEAVSNARNGVVRVLTKGENSYGTGTAFGVGTIGEPTDIFITNRHVILTEDAFGREVVGDRVYLMVDNSAVRWEYTGVAYPTGDVEVIEKKADADTERMIPCDVLFYSETYDFAILKASRVVEDRIALELVESSKEAQPSDPVYAMGYPASSNEFLDNSGWVETGKYMNVAVEDPSGDSTDETADTITVALPFVTKTESWLSDLEDMTVSTGVVSRHAEFERQNKSKVIQHDAMINHGNSGGPLLNHAGQVIAVNTYVDNDKLFFSLYIDYVREKLDEMEIPYNIPSESAGAKDSSSGDDGNLLIYLIIGAVVAAAAVGALLVVNSRKKKQAAQPQKAPEPVRYAYVRSLAPQHGGMRVPVQGQAMLIGRSRADCAIAFAENSPGVSGRHCSLYWDGTAFVLTDLRSTYGTYLQNGQKLTPGAPCRLAPGTSFWLGDKQNVLRVELE